MQHAGVRLLIGPTAPLDHTLRKETVLDIERLQATLICSALRLSIRSDQTRYVRSSHFAFEARVSEEFRRSAQRRSSGGFIDSRRAHLGGLLPVKHLL